MDGRRACIGLVLSALLMVGCGGQVEPPRFKGTDITSAEFGRSLSLTDHNGRRVTLETFRGKLVVLFFGYTHCPDVCPTTLSDMAQAFQLMGPDAADKVQVLFASVDPERDAPEILKAYVPYFHESFLGLYGTPEEVATAANEFKVMYRKHVEPGATGYLVDHSAGSYVLDGQGRLRLYLPFAHPPQDIAQDLNTLLHSG
ncbi:MAG: SCO family protein [Thiobacillus sp.]|nr:SCO family protein [Thiobacillus sp.]